MQKETNNTKETRKMNGLELSVLIKIGKDALAFLNRVLEAFPAKSRKILSYKDVIQELVNNKPQDPSVVKGAAIRKRLNEKIIEVTILYLNSNNEPVFGSDEQNPYGCIIKCEQLDQELLDTFDAKDLIIFE